MNTTILQRIREIDGYLEECQYVLSGQRYLNTDETMRIRAQVNLAKNQLQALKEEYRREHP